MSYLGIPQEKVYTQRDRNETITASWTFTKDINGTCSTARWADLAEKYEMDDIYEAGTLVQFGGIDEVTVATTDVNGVVSYRPGFKMNSDAKGDYVVMIGRSPICVVGPVCKFDKLVLSKVPGKAKRRTLIDRILLKKVIGISLEDKDEKANKVEAFLKATF